MMSSSESPSSDGPSSDSQRVELAHLMQQLNGALVDAELDAQGVESLSDLLQRGLALVEKYPASRWWQRQPLRSGFTENSPFRGSEHPFAPQLAVRQIDGPPLAKIEATCRLGSAYEGPPGVVHGGMIAALFDEVFAAAQHASGAGRGARTARLSVRYRRPTPLNTDLVFQAKAIKVSGRRSSLTATLSVEGAITASAEALFVGSGSPRQ